MASLSIHQLLLELHQARKNSMDLSAWLIRIAEEGLRDAKPRNGPPPLPAPADPAAGAAEQRETILLAEAFGLPPPSREPIHVNGPLRM